jgi:hypothetical protein
MSHNVDEDPRASNPAGILPENVSLHAKLLATTLLLPRLPERPKKLLENVDILHTAW